MMFHVRISPREITRLDGEYYNPLAIAVDARVRSGPHSTFGKLVTRGYRVVYHGVDQVDPRESLPFLAPSDIDSEGEFDVDGVGVRVPRDYAVKYAKGVASPGELLIEVKGKTEKVAVVPLHLDRQVMVSGSLYKAVMGPQADPHFVLAYLMSTPGNTLKRRVVSNINISYIGKGDLYAIPVPKPSVDAQAYIGNKVRQAEGLRAAARALEGRFRDEVSSRMPPLTEEDRRFRASRVQPNELTDRLDAKYYGAEAREIRAFLGRASTKIEDLRPIVNNGFEHRDFVDDGRPYLTVGDASGGRLLVGQAPRISWDVAVPPRATVNERCLLVVRTGSIGTAVQPMKEDGHAAISSHFIRLEFDSANTAAAVAAFLSSEPGQVLQKAGSYGAVQPQVSQDEIMGIPIPESLLSAGESLHKAKSRFEAARRAAHRLVQAARFLVEALIEGRVGEAELAAAYKSPEADCALLKRLTVDGIDMPSSDPLFPDLERLKELLTQAKPEEPE